MIVPCFQAHKTSQFQAIGPLSTKRYLSIALQDKKSDSMIFFTKPSVILALSLMIEEVWSYLASRIAIAS
jgi:hypothetical protein